MMYESETNVLTDAQHGPEHSGVLDCGAVPPVVPELPLTFPDPVPGAPAHVDHVVSVEAAQLLLTLRQSLDPETWNIEQRESRGAYVRREDLSLTHPVTDLVWQLLFFKKP